MPPTHDHILRLFLLGRFELRHGTSVILDDGWPREKARALLKLIALQPERSLPRHAVYKALWPCLPEENATRELYNAYHYLNETALQMNTRMRAAPYVAHTHREYARMLLERGRPQDWERARAMLSEASRTADQPGMPSLVGWCAQIRAREGWPDERTPLAQ